jgi:hypothetical protein
MSRGNRGGERSAGLVLAAVLVVALCLLAGAVLGVVAISASGWRATPQAWPSWTNLLSIFATLVSVVVFALISALLAIRLKDAADLRGGSIQELFGRERSSGLPARFEQMGGAEFENEVAGLLGGLGYSVQRARASGDKGVDLILKKGNRKVAVQLKRWTAPVGHRAVQAAFEGRIHHGADEAWLVTTSRFTPRAAELARTTGVRLVDGAELADWLNSSPRGA